MPVRHVDNALVRALAQAFHWERLLDEGEYATVSELAAAKKLDRTVVSRMLRLTLLAPQLVEAILDGRQSEAVQLQKAPARSAHQLGRAGDEAEDIKGLVSPEADLRLL